MSDLTIVEKRKLEQLLRMTGGYVLAFVGVRFAHLQISVPDVLVRGPEREVGVERTLSSLGILSPVSVTSATL